MGRLFCHQACSPKSLMIKPTTALIVASTYQVSIRTGVLLSVYGHCQPHEAAGAICIPVDQSENRFVDCQVITVMEPGGLHRDLHPV